MGEPARFGARSFLIYATPVAGGGAIVVASDAALLLRSVAWPQLPADPTVRHRSVRRGLVRMRDVRRLSGRRSRDGSELRRRGAASSPVRLDARPGRAAGALPRRRDLRLREGEPADRQLDRHLGRLDAADPRSAEQSALSRIVTTAVAAAIVVALVGMVVLRQQRRAAALANQLSYARAQAKAHDLENQLIRADRLITVGVMATEIAHEVGTPLAVVRGRAEQIGRGLGGGRGRRGSAASSSGRSTRSRRRSGSSSTSRGDRRSRSGRSRWPWSSNEPQKLLQLKLEARRLQLAIALSEDLPMLTADPDQLQQVLVNLLLNACDASSPGGHISLSAAPRSERHGPDRGRGPWYWNCARRTWRASSIRSSRPSRAARGPGSGSRSPRGSFATTPARSSFEACRTRGRP